MDVEKTIRSLKLRGYSVQHFATGAEAAEYLSGQIEGTTVGIGGCMTARDHRLLAHVKNVVNRNVRVGCTGCGYCMPCPKGVDIPGTFRCYNSAASEGLGSARRDYLQATAMRSETSSASQCIRCGKCEQHCPQHLPIRDKLAEAAKELETPVYKIAKAAIHIGKFY